ncbi:protein of unknown function [Latilactobacillus sakei]|nr:protein of unknown function [Latilactobacillus sakei]
MHNLIKLENKRLISYTNGNGD